MSHPPPFSRSLWRSACKLRAYLRPEPGRLSVALGLGAASAAVSSLEPLLLKHWFDALLQPSALDHAWRFFVSLAALLVFGELLSAWQNRLVWRLRLGLDFSLLQAAVDRLHALPLSYHREQS